jgi:hypothetical protein
MYLNRLLEKSEVKSYLVSPHEMFKNSAQMTSTVHTCAMELWAKEGTSEAVWGRTS